MSLTQEQKDKIWDNTLKNMPAHKLAQDMSLTITEVLDCIQEMRIALDERIASNPDLLDKKIRHIHETLMNYDLIKKNAWDMYGKTPEANANARAKFLKLAMDVEDARAKILQLMGTDKEASARAELARIAQNQFIGIVKGVVGNCPKCLDAMKRAMSASRMSVTVIDDKPDNVVVSSLVSGDEDK